VGSGAQRLALGDVDGDGNLDVLTANPSNGTVSVRLGTGQGYFAAPATGAEVAAGTSPNDLALGDIDSDGDLDLMVAHTNFNMDFDADPTLKIRLNDGAGHFAPPATGADVLAGQVARGLALGDIDGDGDLDAVAASGDELSVRLNDGTGRFTAPATGAQVPTSLNNAQVVLGDVDADGDLDVLTVNRRSSSAISVRLNDGLGHFAPPAANAELLIGNGDTLTLMLGDVDSDGDLDLLVPIGITVAVRLNQPAAPALTVASPAAAGVGIPVTFTGMDLDGATGVTVGGTAATITARSATSLTFVVPAGVVPGTFPVVVTTPGGAASLSYTILAAPGNALAFDGSGDYVRLPAGTVAALQNDFTLEYWVRTTQAGTGSSGGQWWEGTGLLDGEVNGPAADYGTSLLAGRVAFGVGGGTGQFATIKDVTIQSTTLVNDGRWHYVVATRRASDGLMTLYIDGQPQATDIGSRSARSAPPQLTLGVLQSTAASGSNFFQGSLDEVRLWSQVRSASDIAAAYLAGPQANLSQSGLVAYYSFDEGLPGGTNADAATLYDLTPSALAGTLTGFALASGTTSSNFVASYALVVPTATAATSKTVSGFTANWTASAVGTLDSYLLDVSTAADFSAPVAGSPFAVAASARSKALTGLSNGTSYYYRLRAELSSLTGQGAPSNVVGVSAPLPVTLVAFTAERLEADGLLRWATASELNNAYYQIESSVDGVAFQPLGRVAGAGTSTQAHSYQFVDKSLARYGAPRVYYRLRQVDADGTSAYSPVQALAVPLAAGLAVQAYPNPSARADEVTLAIGTDQAGPVALVLVNALGQQISQQQLMLPAGASTVPLAGASQLPAGVYLLRVRQGAQQQVLKLVRQ
jgi:hypothetical protein